MGLMETVFGLTQPVKTCRENIRQHSPLLIGAFCRTEAPRADGPADAPPVPDFASRVDAAFIRGEARYSQRDPVA